MFVVANVHDQKILLRDGCRWGVFVINEYAGSNFWVCFARELGGYSPPRIIDTRRLLSFRST